jgi:RES domain-containing protein
VTLPRQWQRQLLALVKRGGALEREYFRSVELTYAHPDDVVSGEGTRGYGGRFVKPGVRAVYGSADEHTAIHESAARKARLARRAGISVTDYPRITYVIAVRLSLHIDLTVVDTGVAAVLTACLDTGDLSASQEVGEFCREQGVQGILYPSAIPAFSGTNLVVFRDVAPQPEIVLVNRDQIIGELRRLAGRLQS